MSALEMSARYHQDELLREAANARLVHEAHGEHSAHHHQVIAAVVAVLMTVALMALI
jgi:hypothetical protein